MKKLLSLLAMAGSLGAADNWVCVEGNVPQSVSVSVGHTQIMNSAVDVDSWASLRLWCRDGVFLGVENGVAARFYMCNEFSVGPEVCAGLICLGWANTNGLWASYVGAGVRTETRLDERMSLLVRAGITPIGFDEYRMYPTVSVGLKIGF